MSNRLTIAREALQLLLAAARKANADSHRLPSSTATALLSTIGQAEPALIVTGFQSPPSFPSKVELRNGRAATLVARFGDQLVGLIHGADGDEPSMWNDDGSMFDGNDPDESDLVMPEAAPLVRIIA